MTSPCSEAPGDPKQTVSVSFGCDATFKWARRSDRDGESILVMDGTAQSDHWTEAGVQDDRINLTYKGGFLGCTERSQAGAL